MKTKRPHVRFQPGLGRKICDALSTGRSLTEICEEPGMPDRHSVRRWVIDHPEDFGTAYKEAQRWWCHAVAEDLNDLADSAPRVAAEAAAKGINENAAIQALRLQIDTKKWTLSKLVPGTYGDRVASQVEVTGAGGKDLIPEKPQTEEGARAQRTKIAMVLLNLLQPAGNVRGEPEPLPAPERPSLPAVIWHEKGDPRLIEGVATRVDLGERSS